MMRKLPVFIFIYVSLNASAQQALNPAVYIDSLERELRVAKNDSIKARRAYDLSEQWGYTDTLKAKAYLTQAKRLSPTNKFLNALYTFYYALYMYDLNTEVSMKEYMLANKKLKQFDTREAYYFRARSWRNFSSLQQKSDDENGMLQSLTANAIPLAQKAGDKELEGELYSLIGLVFMNKHIYYKAIEHYKKGASIVESGNPSTPRLVDIYDNMARAYIFSDSLPQAKIAIDEVRNRLKDVPVSSYTLDLYDTESMYFRKAKEFAKAKISLDNGIALAKKLNDSMQVSSMQFNLFKLYFDEGKFKQARDVLQTVIDGPGSRHLGNRLMYYHDMSETYEKLNDFPNAYAWLKKMFTLWDSSYVEKMRTNIIDIESKYQKAEKEKEILTLKNQQAMVKQQKKINTLIYLLIIGLLLSTVIITFLQLRNKKRKEQTLKDSILQMEQEKKLSTYEALIDGQEKERTRLATELHDGLGGMLAAVKMNLSNTAKDIEGIQSVIETSATKLDHSIQELRLIARNLMPPSLRKLGLVSALQDFCEGVSNAQMNIVFQSYAVRESEIDENNKLIIYRIFQELITNAVKHSGGTEILADLVQSEDQIQITVEDNGKGFETKDEKYKGIGLDNIRSRVDFLKGNMDIESNTQFGTTISIIFNINNTNG